MFQNLKLSLKLIVGFSLVLLLSTVVTVVGVVQMNKIASATDDLYSGPYTVHTAILRAQRNLKDMDRYMKDVASARDETVLMPYINRIDELEEMILKEFEIIYEHFLGDKELVDNALATFNDWAEIREQVVSLQQVGFHDHANKVRREEGARQVELINDAIQEIVDFAGNNATRLNADAQVKATQSRNLVLMLLLLAYVLAAIVIFAITRSITRPVANLLSFSQGISHGDLSLPAVDYQSSDEIGVLTKALNGMRESLRNMVVAVNSSVNEANASSEQMSAGAQETSASVEELASTVNEFASAVDHLSENAQAMAESAKRTSDLSNQGSVEIEHTVRTMGEISELVTILAADIQDLGRQSEEIGEIVNLITGIAEQTNLLALNAAIEAARAGEQGRGFAVVADEVRELAEQSADAAGEITQLITQIRDSARNSVKRTELGTTKVQEGMDVVNKSGRMFREIAAIIETLVEEINAVASAAQQLAAGAEEMGATTEEQSASTEQMAASAVEVSEAVAKVYDEMNWFKVQ